MEVFEKAKKSELNEFFTQRWFDQFPVETIFESVENMMILIDNRLELIVLQMKPFNISICKN